VGPAKNPKMWRFLKKNLSRRRKTRTFFEKIPEIGDFSTIFGYFRNFANLRRCVWGSSAFWVLRKIRKCDIFSKKRRHDAKNANPRFSIWSSMAFFRRPARGPSGEARVRFYRDGLTRLCSGLSV
jgi:hypothetical protein